MEFQRRLPGVEKKISEIQPETDVRIRLMGTVIGVNQNNVILDDGSGKVEIGFDYEPAYISEGQIVKVLTRVLPILDGFECKGECIQVLNDFNVQLYNKVQEFIRGEYHVLRFV